MTEHKVCADCGEEKGLSEYYLNKEGKPKNSRCKECYKIWHNKYRRDKTALAKRLRPVVPIPDSKICSKCFQDKPLYDFHADKEGRFGVSGRCKKCKLKYMSDRKKTDPEVHLEAKKRSLHWWNNLSPDDKQEKLSRQYANRQKRLENDPEYRLSKNLRGRMTRAISQNYKSGSAVRDLGCTIKECKDHIESKFQPGMNWGNYGRGKGKWNIDHIVPLSAFDLTDRQHVVLVCHYLNLQSLWFEENISKGGIRNRKKKEI